MRVRLLVGLVLVLIVPWPCAAQTDGQRPSLRMSRPPADESRAQLRSIVTCGPGERQCAIGGAISWCCRADQQCHYGYPGACK